MSLHEEDKLTLLRDILLIDDREVAKAVERRLEIITDTLEKKEKLSQRVDPIIQEKLDEFIQEIPTTLGPTITKTLQQEIANSKDQVVDALYPIMGRMIKKYIQNEIKALSETINKKVNDTFFILSWLKRKVKSKVSGIKESDLILSELDTSKINEVFLIEKGSGILLAHYSLTDTVDKEMISGMLTAIKSFVEDAFKTSSQNLETIEYEFFTTPHSKLPHLLYCSCRIRNLYSGV